MRPRKAYPLQALLRKINPDKIKILAERVGFEPTVPTRSTSDFESDAIDQLYHLSIDEWFINDFQAFVNHLIHKRVKIRHQAVWNT